MKDQIRIEFHCHTAFSKDSLTSPSGLVAACRKKGIDRIVVTDHNTIAGALEAQKLAPEMVITGEEIMTEAGELLAAFVREEVPKGLPALETIGILRNQGAFISVSHPFDVTRRGHWEVADLLRIAPLVDAIEIFNARCISADFDRAAQLFAREHGLPGTVGSDAHGPVEIGQATMRLPGFNDRESLLRAMQQVEYDLKRSPPYYRLISRWAVMVKAFRGRA